MSSLRSGCFDEQLEIRLLVWRLDGYDNPPVKEPDGEEIKDTASEGIRCPCCPQGAARAAEVAAAEAKKDAEARAAATEAPKKRLFQEVGKERGKSAADGNKQEKAPSKSVEKKSEKKPVRKSGVSGSSKMCVRRLKRVTWPTKQDVLRWSVVVVCALRVLRQCHVAVSTIIITPMLLGISGIGRLGVTRSV